MRAEIIATLGRIGNPDSLMKVMEYARRIEEQDEEDDFENVGKDELWKEEQINTDKQEFYTGKEKKMKLGKTNTKEQQQQLTTQC